MVGWPNIIFGSDQVYLNPLINVPSWMKSLYLRQEAYDIHRKKR